ncbi:MAG: DUF4115 domain-containing protein [Gammaproteobacteria bacterium]|nr:DUF4115 domain-containing protein [Gammaproteobacteria bacterium]
MTEHHDDVDAASEEQQPAGIQPGEALKRERESHDLTLGQVAMSLHVAEAMLAALERDEYASLGAPVFVKGHIRNYAKLLDMEAAPLVAAYEASQHPSEPGLVKRSAEGPSMAPGVGLGWLRVVGGILLLVLLIGSAGWWYYNHDAMPAESQEDISQGMLPAVDRLEEPAVAADVAGAEPAGGDSEPVSGSPAGPDKDPETVSPAEDADANALGRETGRQPAANSRQLSSNNASTVERPSESNTADNVAPAVTEQQAEADGVQRTIELAFDEECWVEIYDSNGKALLYDLQTAGSRRVVTAEGAVRIFLGNAPAVSIMVDGEEFDLADYTRRDNTARFGIPTSR